MRCASQTSIGTKIAHWDYLGPHLLLKDSSIVVICGGTARSLSVLTKQKCSISIKVRTLRRQSYQILFDKIMPGRKITDVEHKSDAINITVPVEL